MSGRIKTIAVHLPAAGLVERLLDAALPLAKENGATLVGVHVVPAVVIYADATASMSTEFIVAQQEAFGEDAQAIEQTFRDRLGPTGVPFEWRSSDSGEEATMRAVAACCNTADLVMGAQSDDSIPAATGYTPDELALRTGRPILIVPGSAPVREVGNRVVIAWNGSREAARAAFDCLPLLRAGAQLTLLAIDSTKGAATMQAMANALSRHGLQVETVSLSRSDGRSTSDEILKFAAEFDADLLVLGCYGHSRLRETVFGGATTRILRAMTLPLLMAH